MARDRPYLGGVRYLARFSPFAAYRDLRLFLSYRQPHQLVFAVLAVGLTVLLILGFFHDSRMPQAPERRSIQYFESWPLSRTDREIIEQQKRDMIARDRRDAEIRKERLAQQRKFQQMDEQLKAIGL